MPENPTPSKRPCRPRRSPVSGDLNNDGKPDLRWHAELGALV
jgi:hypothetical protein